MCAWIGGRLEPLFTPDLAQEACHDMADDGGRVLLTTVVENTPVSYHRVALEHQGHTVARTPGTLKRSWYRQRPHVVRRPHGVSMAYESRVATDDPIAPYVEEDTPPHEIRPKKPGGTLRFRAWPTGEVVYAKVVHHPGTRGAHMMLTAVNATQIAFTVICKPRAERWAKAQARHCMRVNRQ